jgi:hypothetical protein
MAPSFPGFLVAHQQAFVADYRRLPKVFDNPGRRSSGTSILLGSSSTSASGCIAQIIIAPYISRAEQCLANIESHLEPDAGT